MKKLICRLIGHDIDQCDCYAVECLRCGLVWDWMDGPPRNDLLWWLGWARLHAGFRITTIRFWLVCPDCGGRLGKHKPDCMPF